MAIPLLFIPLLFAGADPKVVATGDHARIEQLLSDGVRARASAGWELVDLRTVNDEFVVTMRKRDTVEKHILHFDTKRTYRVEQAASAPVDASEPSDFMRQALLAPRGGFELSASCGGYYERPYLIDDEAAGEFATSLVARSLATATELRSAWRTDSRAEFSISKHGVERKLLVWLDRGGNVIEAQVRRYDHEGGDTYGKLPELRRAMTRTRVLAIVPHKTTFALVTSKGTFAFDSTAFDYSASESEGCGC